MSERMSKSDREDQLLRILTARRAKAQSRADFTARSIAGEGGVSVVWFYALVGKQYRKLRAGLQTLPAGEKTPLAKKGGDIAEHRARLKELKGKYETSIKRKLAEAIRMIELLDEENRLLREKVAGYEERSVDDSDNQ